MRTLTTIGKRLSRLSNADADANALEIGTRADLPLGDGTGVPSDCALPLRLGFIACAVVLIGFGGWSLFASISSAVVANGRVVVEGSVRSVQHPDGGVIAEILAHDGLRVHKGDTLLRLDSTQLESDVAIVDNRLQEALARRARLEAERDGASGLLQLDNADAASAAFQAENKVFEARAARRLAQEDRLKTSIAQATEQIHGLREQRAAHLRRGELVEQELAAVRDLVSKRIVAVTTQLELERKASEIEGLAAGLTAEIAVVGQKIEELKVQILEHEHNWREEVLSDLRQADLEVNELVERRAAVLSQLKRVNLRAPIAGTVNNMTVNTIGGVVRPAESVMEIVPDEEELIVEAAIDPLQIDRLHEGQNARVALSALDARTTPELTGVLAHVSADVVEEPQTQVEYYVAKVRIPPNEIERLRETRLVPGMPAQVFFETGSRSPMSYLLRPLFGHAGRALNER